MLPSPQYWEQYLRQRHIDHDQEIVALLIKIKYLECIRQPLLWPPWLPRKTARGGHDVYFLASLRAFVIRTQSNDTVLAAICR